MIVVNITLDEANHYSIPEQCIESLRAALLRVIDDGASALNKNAYATLETKQSLQRCISCVPSVGAGLCVVDGDAWERIVHPDDPSMSIDIVFLIEGDNGSRFGLPVEAKLGMACDYPGDRGGSSINLIELEAKVDGLKALVGSTLPVIGKLILIVPNNGKEWAWYCVRRWNLAGNKIGKIFSCCISDFLRLIGCAEVNEPIECKTQLNEFRHRLFVEEFMQSGPMSQVQLPQAGICIGCRKCRDACRKKAIAVIEDDQGRVYPFVDKMSCKSGCRHCESVCPIIPGRGSSNQYEH